MGGTTLTPPASVEAPEPGYGAVLTLQGCLPLREMAVEAHAVGLLYRLRVQQTFVNAYELPLEATYIFPLPPRAGVTSFQFRVRDRIVEGQLQERFQALFQMQATDMQQAQAIYRQVASDTQKQRAERWKIMQDTQSKIFEITQDVTVNKARTNDQVRNCLRGLLEMITRCPACQEPPAGPEHRHELHLEWDDAEWLAEFRKDWEHRTKLLVDLLTESGMCEWLADPVELALTALEDFDKRVEQRDPAACEDALQRLEQADAAFAAERRRLEEEWGFQ